MGRAILALALALVLLGLGAGCGGDEPDAAVPCDDAAFRAQDEELYVTRATISNAIGGGSGDPAALLLDLRRARAALGGYLDTHPPCDGALRAIAATEEEAIASLDEAIAALDRGTDARKQLAGALQALRAAQSGLDAAG